MLTILRWFARLAVGGTVVLAMVTVGNARINMTAPDATLPVSPLASEFQAARVEAFAHGWTCWQPAATKHLSDVRVLAVSRDGRTVQLVPFLTGWDLGKTHKAAIVAACG